MLLKITNKCTMGCSHCLSDCRAQGIDMTRETLNHAIEFCKLYKPYVINITGGEPMEHPEFWDIYEKIVTTFPSSIVNVITNGEWMDNHMDEFLEKYEKFKYRRYGSRFWEISRDGRYYPKPLSKEFIDKLGDMANINIYQSIDYIYPIGRAADNDIPSNISCPSCFNIRSISDNVETLKMVFRYLTYAGKFCTPSIEPDGSINLGESSLCPNCSDIWKSDKEIIDDIRNFRCTNCSELINRAIEKYGPQVKSVMKMEEK